MAEIDDLTKDFLFGLVQDGLVDCVEVPDPNTATKEQDDVPGDSDCDDDDDDQFFFEFTEEDNEDQCQCVFNGESEPSEEEE